MAQHGRPLNRRTGLRSGSASEGRTQLTKAWGEAGEGELFQMKRPEQGAGEAGGRPGGGRREGGW